MVLDARHKYIVGGIAQTFGIEYHIAEEFVTSEKTLNQINDLFRGAEGINKLLIFYQTPNVVNDAGEVEPGTGKPVLTFSTGDHDRLRGPCVYFIRTSTRAVTVNTLEDDIAYGELTQSPLETMHLLLSEVYLPILEVQEDWGQVEDVQNKEYLRESDRFTVTLNEALASLQSGIALARPDKRYDVENKQPAFNRAATDPETVQHYETVLEDWCIKTEYLLEQSDANRKEPEDAGPSTELEFWKGRLAKFNSITEQLKTRECKIVLGVLTAAKSRFMKKWKTLDNAITDAANEAKDNVKYLQLLEKYTEPLYNGTPASIIEGLPGLMNNIKMMLTLSKYYNTTQRMTTLFSKITNQMITNAKWYIGALPVAGEDESMIADNMRRQATGHSGLGAAGKLWQVDLPSLLRALKLCMRLNDVYYEQYKFTKDKLMVHAPKGRQFDFSEPTIFGKFDLFCKRLRKLIEVFETIAQFQTLASHKIDGMEGLMLDFEEIVKNLRKKHYDFLDHTNVQFDKDFEAFNESILALEASLQDFINLSFENISSTEQALNLLKQFQAILQRDNLKVDLDSKYMQIFQNYGFELEAVQQLYESQKHNPPMIRNAAPVTGNICWARQLVTRIEEPMRKFQTNASIMTTKEAKKIIRTYNRVARALIEFETLWQYAWGKSIDAARAGLQATLIIRHPENNTLYVNFDPEILQLIREAKSLLRMGMDVPENARMVLLQEDKFKSYYDELMYLLAEYRRVTDQILPVTRNLLQSHVGELESKIQPGMTSLTWTSMNIDAYLHRIHTSLAHLEETIAKINDVVDNRIENNLKSISNTLFVELQDDKLYTLDEFVNLHEKHVKAVAVAMDQKNLEVENAVNDLVDLIRNAREDQDAVWDEQEEDALRAYYSRMMFQAILKATKNSLATVKKRLGSRAATGFLVVAHPLFNVDVELTIPEVMMNPSLDEIQGAINRTAMAVIHASKQLYVWGQDRSRPPKVTFFELISNQKAVVRDVLLLTGGIDGLKKQVHAYLQTYLKYDYLWKDDRQLAYSNFLSTNPDLDAFEEQMKRYMAIEQEIADVEEEHTIGALNLQTESLKYSLKSEAASWKSLYATSLHKQAKTDLDAIYKYMNDTNAKLAYPVKDIDDLRQVLNVIQEIRDREADIDLEFIPVEDQYALLIRYGVRVDKTETDAVSDMRHEWKKMTAASEEVARDLTTIQGDFKRDLIRDVKGFLVDVIQFRNDYDANGPTVGGLSPGEAVERLKKFKRLYEDRELKAQYYTAGEELFGLPVTEYPELVKTKKELSLLSRLYDMYIEVLEMVKKWEGTLWSDIRFNPVSQQLDQYSERCRKLPKTLRDWPAYHDLKKTIDDFTANLPLFQGLADKAMRNRHWQQAMQITGKSFRLDPDFLTLKHIIDADVVKHRDEVIGVTTAAQRELDIETKLHTIQEDWDDQTFTFVEYKNRGVQILKGNATQNILDNLEESQTALASMKSSRYIAPFKVEVTSWLSKFSTVADVIEQWLSVQASWIHLESVFTSKDIVMKLPREAKRFAQVDKNWFKIQTKATENPNVINLCCGSDFVQNMLPHLKDQLDICQKALAGHLETKRSEFPRFAFVSDSVLLDILSQTSEPASIQPHLKSLFANIDSLEFELAGTKKDKHVITAMLSREGEKINLIQPVVIDTGIEQWLRKLEDEMRNTMKAYIQKASSDCMDLPTIDFVQKFPAQVALLGMQFVWTKDSHEALARCKQEKAALSNTAKKNATALTQLVGIAQNDLTPLERVKMETIITVQVHQRDVFDQLVAHKVTTPSDFEWMKQARFGYDVDEGECIVSIADVDTAYCYEYLGCQERLVVTPLTDRCYISLTQALSMQLGGSPIGPAGTGKTETVKDLGRNLGKYVVVFNCSDQMDYKNMGKIIKGLSASGAWGCFDEFNRLNVEVLSVVAQQLALVFIAAREGKDKFVFTDGQMVGYNFASGFFITMNPGYAGRQELPENLKSLFRGVTMMVPDKEIIIKVKLASQGFQQAAVLAKKFTTLYSIAEHQCSHQHHYDWGLRNVLSVLRTTGAAKRANPSEPEQAVLVSALNAVNIAKLVQSDVGIFRDLIEIVFPDTATAEDNTSELIAAVQDQLAVSGLVYHEPWIEKVVQLYQTSRARHGVMLVGPAGSGKSTCLEVLLKSLTAMGDPHSLRRINPKAVTSDQLFGKIDLKSDDWTEGILSALWRKSLKTKKQKTWICMDGPIDAEWIENLNSVLDDSRILTLVNGDRLPLTNAMRLVFETENLENASPATVSRAGMVYISEQVLGWQPVMAAWLKSRPVDQVGPLTEIFKAHLKNLESIFTFVLRDCNPDFRLGAVQMAHTFISILESLIEDALDSYDSLADAEPEADEDEEGEEAEGEEAEAAEGKKSRPQSAVKSEQGSGSNMRDFLERMFYFAAVWGVGGLLTGDDAVAFDEFIRTLCDNMPGEPGNPNLSVYSYWVDISTTDWASWEDRTPLVTFPDDPNTDLATVHIPTPEGTRAEYLIDMVSRRGAPVLFIGEDGVGKTMAVDQYASALDQENWTRRTLSFSTLTSPHSFQHGVESVVEKIQGRSYGPPGGKKMLLFIDDLSLPQRNEWGDQPTNEVVRQLIEQEGLYNLAKPGEWTSIQDVHFMAAMSVNGNEIPERLKRHFHVIRVTVPGDTSIESMFTDMLAKRFSGPELQNSVSKLVAITLELWNLLREGLLPIVGKEHYAFTVRDLHRVFMGMTRVSPSTVATEVDLLALWKHECSRVLRDKLATSGDVAFFNKNIHEVLENAIGAGVAGQLQDDPLFCNFLHDEEEEEHEEGEEVAESHMVQKHAAPFEMVKDDAILYERIYEYIEQYNQFNAGKELEVVLFPEWVSHLLRISRILSRPGGHALLLGVVGSGRQCMTRLASFIANHTTFQITTNNAYGVGQFLDDMRSLYKLAGVAGKKVTFLFTENELKDDAYLEYINSFLKTGDIPNLFNKDELEVVYSELRAVAKDLDPHFLDTPESLHKFFLERVQANLHIVLSFSHGGRKLSERIRKFPGIVSGCTIDWFMPWDMDALTAVARKYLMAFEMECNDETKEKVVQHLATVHSSMSDVTAKYMRQFKRSVYVTPKLFTVFVDNYITLYARKYEEVSGQAANVKVGLSKLEKAGRDVKDLSAQLAEKDKHLKEVQVEYDEILATITSGTVKAEKKKSEVQAKKNEIAATTEMIAKEKADAERDLAAAKPALDDAINALKAIKSGDISALKSMTNPPDLIKRIFDCVLIIRRYHVEPVEMVDTGKRKGIKTSYPTAQKMMADSGFIKALMNFDKDSINAETVELLQPYLSAPDFNPASAKKTSGNVGGLASWVGAMTVYYDVARAVRPKIDALKEAETRLEAITARLTKAEEELQVHQAEVDKMQAEFDEKQVAKQAVVDDAEKTQSRIDKANALLSGLSGEQDRWTEQMQQFEETLQLLVGDCVSGAAALTYFAPFNNEYRDKVLEQVSKSAETTEVSLTTPLDLTKFLADEATIGGLTLEGIPADPTSIQNGVLVINSNRHALFIDPQGQAAAWIRNREAENGLKVTTLKDKNLRNVIEEALLMGTPLLLENVTEDLDPILDPLFDMHLVRVGRSLKIVMPDGPVDYNENFRLYLTTRVGNPLFSPAVSSRAMVVDFTVNQSGLESQLLTRVIMKEKAMLEEQRHKLLQDITDNTAKIAALERDLLAHLSKTEGDLLEDTALVDLLSTTKRTAQEVTQALKVSAENEIKINSAREEYRPVATRGAILYTLASQMLALNPMYQTSMEQFLKLFDLGIKNAERAPLANKRIANIIQSTTWIFFNFVSRGYFEQDKFLFRFMLALRIELASGNLSQNEFNYLLLAGAAVSPDQITEKKTNSLSWINEKVWANIWELTQKMEVFADIIPNIQRKHEQWKTWADDEVPEKAEVPELIAERMTSFNRLLLVRCFRPDRLIVASREFIASVLGEKYVVNQPLDLKQVVDETDNRTPMLLILSPGSDPSGLIETLIKKEKKENTAWASLGQGQERRAMKHIAEAASAGNWAVLQNAHFGLSFLDTLAEWLASEEQDISPNFRLFVTAQVHPQFPISFLSAARQISTDQPKGLKEGMKQTIASISNDLINAVDRIEYRTLLYGLTFLHSVVQERRKFGSLGWNIPYEFNLADLKASAHFLCQHLYSLQNNNGISWSALRYMISDVQYGGKITDDFDRRLFSTYFDYWLNQGIFSNNFTFAPGYEMCNDTDLTRWKGHVADLPTVDIPEVFGLHPNADLTFRENEVNQLLSAIQAIQPAALAADSADDMQAEQEKIVTDVLERLPKPIKAEYVTARLEKLGGPSLPMNVFLSQEVGHLQRVLGVLQRSLNDARRAIHGEIMMTDSIGDVLNALTNAQVPTSWLEAAREDTSSHPPLGAWMTLLGQRADALTAWLGSRPNVYWLPGFFNPAGFLMAVRQNECRNQGWALDAVTFTTEVMPYEKAEMKREKDKKKKGDDDDQQGLLVYGLSLEGCGWDKANQKICESQPKQLHVDLPVFRLSVIPVDNAPADTGSYSAPVYRCLNRSAKNYICDITLQSDEAPKKWVLRGVAAFCNTF